MKETFNVGDRVIIHKPSDLQEFPGWYPGMSKIEGEECVISYIGKRLTYTIIRVVESPFSFNLNWCEKVEEIELQDDGQAFEAYITGWEVKQ